MFQEVFNVHACITEGTFERETIYFIMEGENDASPIRVLHFDVATFAVNLHKAHALQRCQDLPARAQG